MLSIIYLNFGQSMCNLLYMDFYFGIIFLLIHEGLKLIHQNENIIYSVPNNNDFLWSEWEDACVVYDKRSGHTQVLNEFAREILALFEDGPKNFEDICIELEEIMGNDLDDESVALIVNTINGFDAMGLIEPV